MNWDMNEIRIIICGRRFPMNDIENGKAEEFIKSLIKEGQGTLDLWK